MPHEISRFIVQELRGAAEFSQRWRLRSGLLVFPLLALAGSWVVFPLLEQFNSGYTVWHLACVLMVLSGPAGLAVWVTERVAGVASPSLAWLLAYAAISALGIFCFLRGDFYWAFERGYFLN